MRSEATHVVFHAWLYQETPLLGAFQLKCEVLLEINVEVCIVALPGEKDLDLSCSVTNG